MPRYEWPAQAMAPHAEPRGQAQPGPAPAATPGPASGAPVPVADGWHRDYRWFVTRHSDALHPIVHIQGWDGPRHVSVSREMEGASRAKVWRFIDQTIESVAANAKRAKGRR